MVRIALKSLLARKLRLALMVFAIVLGVSFVVSSFVISDSLGSTFDKLSTDIEGRTDITVRMEQEFGDPSQRPPIAASVLDIVKKVDGVQAADGPITVFGVTPIKADGEPIKRMGPPMFGIGYGTAKELSPLIQVDGRPPVGEREFNLDITTAEDDGFVVGQTYTISTPTGNHEATLVGTIAFNSLKNDTVGAVLTIFDTPTAQKFLALDGLYSEIAIKVADGVSLATVQERLAAVIPDGTEAVGREVKIQESKDQFGDIASIFGNILLAFALITVVVSSFLINNTFRIVIGQRIRELALMRALGATGRQVMSSVLAEAALVGSVATAVGVGTGVLLAVGLRGLFGAIGFSLPDGPLLVEPRTIVAAAIVGIGVTLISALLPALKVRHIPPMAALRDDFRFEGSGLRRRLVLGGAITVIGATLLAVGLFGSLDTAPLLGMLGGGALATFIGVNLLSPLFAVPVARTLGAPIARFRGVAGRLSRDNAARNPQRTASTAAALMVGVALISMTAVVGTSIKATFSALLEDSVRADFFVTLDALNNQAGFSPEVTKALADRPELSSVLPYRNGLQGIKVEGKVKDMLATDFAPLLDHLDPDVLDGDIAAAGPKGLLVHQDSARDLGLQVGQEVQVTFVDQATETLKVAAIYKDASILGNWVISLDMWDAHFASSTDQFVTAVAADKTDLTKAEAAIQDVLAAYPDVKAENQAEFKKTIEGRVDSILNVVNVMLGFSLFIALLGIYNTLRLSIYERTRELGLLRAVGMSRGQMRAMIRWEAAVVAVFGAVLGVVLGVLFGVAASSALPSSFVSTVTIPFGSLVFYVVIAGLAGLLAAVLPARRAARLNVLDAISYT